MIVRGNSVGTTMPRPDYAETNPESPRYIFNKPDAAIAGAQSRADAAMAAAKAALPLTGGTLTGPLAVQAPTLDHHPATKAYVDNLLEDAHFSARLTLPAAGWTGEGPYTQTVPLAGILETDCPHFGAVYSSNFASEQEAFGCIHRLETAGDSLTFTCFGEKPQVDLALILEVNR